MEDLQRLAQKLKSAPRPWNVRGKWSEAGRPRVGVRVGIGVSGMLARDGRGREPVVWSTLVGDEDGAWHGNVMGWLGLQVW